MPITPYTQPIKYEYKPLNLSAFAQPLSQMQEKFDVATADVSGTEFDLSHLPYGTDPERAKELIKMVQGKRDELAKNLAETKNYKQAAIKLKELNTLWAKDPELQALQSNYKLWQERDKQELDRVAKGEITRDEYRQWKEGEIHRYEKGEGAGFKADYLNPEGTYNPITGSTGRLRNEEKDFEEMKLKIAGMQPEKKSTFFQQNVPSMSDAELVSMERTFAGKDAGEIARETEKYLRRIPRFKAWGEEVAKYNYDAATNYGEDLGQEGAPLVQNTIQKIDKEIAQRSKEKGFVGSEEHKGLLEVKQAYNDMIETGQYAPGAIQHLYTQKHLDNLYGSEDIANILAYKNVTDNHSIRRNPEWEKAQADAAALNLGAGFVSDVKEKLQLDNLTTERIKNAKALLPAIKDINNKAGGVMRTLVMGWEGTNYRKNIQNNPGLMREKQEQIITIAQNSKNAVEFQRNLWNAGIREGNNAETAAKVFKSLSVPETAQEVVRILEASKDTYMGYQTAKGQLENIDKYLSKNEDYLKDVSKLENEGHVFEKEERNSVVRLLGLDPKKASELDISAALKKRGFKTENIISRDDQGGMSISLSYRQIAKLNGYSSMQEAIKKDASIFSNVPILGKKLNTLKETYLAAADKDLVMGHRYVNDKKLDAAMNSLFLGPEDLLTFSPVGYKDWNNVPGFDDTGKPAPGTKLVLNDKSAVKLIQQGNQLMMRVPYEYKKDGQTVITTALVPFKSSSPERQEMILSYLKGQNTGKKDAYGEQTMDMLNKATYDLKTKSTLTQSRADIATVKENQPDAILEEIPGPQPGTTVQIVKRWVNADVEKIMIKVTEAGGTSRYVEDDSGKLFGTQNVDEAKSFLAVKLGM